MSTVCAAGKMCPYALDNVLGILIILDRSDGSLELVGLVIIVSEPKADTYTGIISPEQGDASLCNIDIHDLKYEAYIPPTCSSPGRIKLSQTQGGKTNHNTSSLPGNKHVRCRVSLQHLRLANCMEMCQQIFSSQVTGSGKQAPRDMYLKAIRDGENARLCYTTGAGRDRSKLLPRGHWLCSLG